MISGLPHDVTNELAGPYAYLFADFPFFPSVGNEEARVTLGAIVAHSILEVDASFHAYMTAWRYRTARSKDPTFGWAQPYICSFLP